MPEYAYRIVNVFADSKAPGKLTGNPLCVFEDGRGLDDTAMQALAQQFNLSETTFVLPRWETWKHWMRSGASARSRASCRSVRACVRAT